MPSICAETTLARSLPLQALARLPARVRPLVRESPLRLLDRYKPSDEAERFMFGVIRRFHRGRRRDAPRAFKRVSCPVVDTDGRSKLGADGQPLVRRYIYEASCFVSHQGREWNLIRWGIDVPGVWFNRLASQRALMAAFRQPPKPEQDAL